MPLPPSTSSVSARGAADAGRALEGWMQALVPYGIFTLDADLKVTSWNEWLVAHSGFAAADVLGRPLTALFPDLESRRLLGRYAHALEGEISVLSAALHKYLLPLPSTVPESGLAHMLQTARIAPLRGQHVRSGDRSLSLPHESDHVACRLR